MPNDSGRWTGVTDLSNFKADPVTELLPYPQPADEDSRRSTADIPLAELFSVVLDNPDLLDQADPARDLARLLGVERLAAISRPRLNEAITKARQHLTAA